MTQQKTVFEYPTGLSGIPYASYLQIEKYSYDEAQKKVQDSQNDALGSLQNSRLADLVEGGVNAVASVYGSGESKETRNQRKVEQALADDSFGVAGTGKTFLAVAVAVSELMLNKVQKIILARPAVEAGEHLGFLPGDLSQKVDPYLKPLYDALYEMIGPERVNKLLERGIIELAPLAYMRGRTLNNSYIILDEAQNCTKSQMKMFLTRIGFGSSAIVTGDITQTDLPKGSKSGLLDAIEVLEGEKNMSFSRFQSKDVVRHGLVQRIIEAYDSHEKE